MSLTTSTKTGRHAAAWTFERGITDSTATPGPRPGKHRANLIHTFRKHVKARFGK